jgi:uncharacterized membrane protein YdbT with pleckstrin-like domain
VESHREIAVSDVLYEGRPRIAPALVLGGFVAFLLAGAAWLLLENADSVFEIVLGAGCAAVAAVAVPWKVLDARSRRHVLGESALIYRGGVLSRFEVEIPYANISAVMVNQGILQLPFGCGNVRVAAPGVSSPSPISSRDLNSVCVGSIPDWREVGEMLRERMAR